MNKHLLDLIYQPILTDKTTRILEDNQYCFKVQRSANKYQIKKAIELIFSVKVIKINTLLQPAKKRTVGRFSGYRTRYKKAIVTLRAQDSITLFPDN
uniref:Large ribosomal subunit protein uL23c n=1 Tax=Yamadaella caenomyce TaxID=259029 RepID=A0A1G4NYV4_9FLOR|nr:Ribosomal protein L23 [Yamadaella caenomyce]SCW23838.1 Ribosomal protein L23 [Yamadaella caenomyce]